MYYEETVILEEIEEKNEELLKLFYNDIANLSDKTIKKHMNNVSFFINEFLLYYNNADYQEVNQEIYSFFSDFFIRKCMWSTPNTIKETAASIKKFYKSMVDNGKFDKKEYKLLCDIIKEEMINWQIQCDDYNNGTSDPFLF